MLPGRMRIFDLPLGLFIYLGCCVYLSAIVRTGCYNCPERILCFTLIDCPYIKVTV